MRLSDGRQVAAWHLCPLLKHELISKLCSHLLPVALAVVRFSMYCGLALSGLVLYSTGARLSPVADVIYTATGCHNSLRFLAPRRRCSQIASPSHSHGPSVSRHATVSRVLPNPYGICHSRLPYNPRTYHTTSTTSRGGQTR